MKDIVVFRGAHFNWTNQEFEVIATSQESFNTDEIVQIDLSANSQNFAQASTGLVRTRIGWRKTGFVILFPWTVNIDHVNWTQ